MHILDRLSKDLAELMERELAKPNASPDKLYIALLLLLGWRREGAGKRRQEAVEAEADADDAAEEAPETEEEEEEAEDEDALDALRRQTLAFRQGNPYLAGLLFRDYYADPRALLESQWLPGFGTVKIHAEASRYVNEVLWLKPLGLAKTNGDAPTNPHLLLKRLCQLSRAVGDWAGTDLHRRAQGRAMDATWFHKLALALRAQRKREGGGIGATARNRRAASGPYWLTAGACAEEVGEELSLRDIVEIAPAPLSADLAADPDFDKLLNKVVKALNTRYAWLRACGLLPENWLHQDEPSIDRLKDLAHLREAATAAPSWQDGLKETAFREAFQALLAQSGKSKLGGFETFAAWQDSDEGQAMLYRGADQVVSLADILGGDDPGQDFDGPDENADPAGDIEAWSLLAEIHRDAGPRLADDPLLSAFFHAALVQGREVQGPDGLWADAAFQALQAADPRYAGLAPDALAARLFFAAKALIADVLLATEAVPVAAAVEAYFRWTVVEEKPLRGKDGLLNRKSFKSLLAQDPAYAGLSPDETAERLQAGAAGLLQKLLAARG